MPVDEWDRRVLCPDDGCIGVIGPAGTCNVCGRAAPNWGDERNRGLTPLPPDAPAEGDADADEASSDAETDDAETDADDADADDADADDADADAEADADADALADEEPAAAAAPDWQERKLCSDDACIGVIGDDGACKVCGKRPET